MERYLRFAEPAAFIEVPQELKYIADGNALTLDIFCWANEAAQRLASLSSGVVFRIGKLRLSYEESRKLALRIADVVSDALKSQGMPEKAFVEVDRVRPVNVWKSQVRTLLPHNDGAHCSYLTPSVIDDPTWDTRLRTFSHKHFSTTQTHKMYQGIFIIDPGNGLSITTYYDWLKIIYKAYRLVSHQREISIRE